MKRVMLSKYDYRVVIDRKAFNRASKALISGELIGKMIGEGGTLEQQRLMYRGSCLAVSAIKSMFPLVDGQTVAFLLGDQPMFVVENVHGVTSMFQDPDREDSEVFTFYTLEGIPRDSAITVISTIFLYAHLKGGVRVIGNAGKRTISVGGNHSYTPGDRRIRLEDLYAEYVRSRERREHQGGTHASPVRHSVREHLRQLKNGRVVYVRPTSVEQGNRLTM